MFSTAGQQTAELKALASILPGTPVRARTIIRIHGYLLLPDNRPGNRHATISGKAVFAITRCAGSGLPGQVVYRFSSVNEPSLRQPGARFSNGRFEPLSSSRRVRPDCWYRILYQYFTIPSRVCSGFHPRSRLYFRSDWSVCQQDLTNFRKKLFL